MSESKPVVHRVTVKSLQEGLQKKLAECDDLRLMVENQRKVINDQRKVIHEAWDESRDLRTRLSAVENILRGAVQVAHVPQTMVAMGAVDMAAPESPR
jgi:succinate dehydrogenase/fumarate reductase flavoprotein subunit